MYLQAAMSLSTQPPATESGLAPPVPPRRRRRPPGWLFRTALFGVGLGLIAGGIYVVAVPLLGVWQRGKADDSALQQWKRGGSQALVGETHDTGPAAACGAAGAPTNAYALVTFPSLPQWGYQGVAGDGNWDMLRERSMVHYQGTAAPGQQGNVIIAFHREPGFQHIDDLKPGDEVDVQNRTCTVYHYKVTTRTVLPPDKVTQLVPTTGHDLTLITCTPWFQDYNRIVWQATLSS